jgi:hypothetical protein
MLSVFGKVFGDHCDRPGSPPLQANAQGGVSVSWAKRGGPFQAPEIPEDHSSKVIRVDHMNYISLIIKIDRYI